MTTTILAAFVLSGALAPAAKPEVTVQTDYARALKLAADEKKPMAVLIGKGDGFAQLLADAKLPAETKKALGEKFVCVAVDVSTTAGKELAGQFQMTDGLVISTAGGAFQAVRHAGTVTPADVVKHTGTVAAAAPAVVSCAGGTCALAQTATGLSCAGGTCALASGTCTTGTCGTAAVTSGCSGGSCSGTPARGGFFRRR